MMSKKAKVKNLRNILVSPFHILWKEKREEEVIPVQNILKELLPAAKLEKCVRKKQIKQMKENEDEMEVVSKESPEYTNRSYLVPGFQSVIRSLEEKELCCVIIVEDVTSSLLHKVVFSYAVANNVPVMVIPDLKQITKSTLGFATMALGFKRTVADSPGNIFYPVYRMVLQNPTVFETSMKSAKKDVVPVQDFSDNVSFSELHQPVHPKNKNFYLYRKNIGERAFIPISEVKDNPLINSKTTGDHINDYISLGKSSSATNIDPAADKKLLRTNCSDDDEDDIDDSDDSNIFFVDNKPDDSLLKTERLNVKSEKSKKLTDFSKFPPKGAKKCEVPNLVQIQKSNPENTLMLKSPENTTQYQSKKPKFSDFLDDKNNKKLLKLQKSKSYLEYNSLAGVNFTPMSIKAVTSNSKKIRTKKKKKPKQ